MVASIKKQVTLITFILLGTLKGMSQAPDTIPVKMPAEVPPDILPQNDDTIGRKLTIVFAGDIMGHDGQINGAWDPGSNRYIYEPTFRYARDYISNADLAIANLEVTLAGPPYKGYPEFSSPDELAIAAREAGFDVFLQANNHALDRGVKGFVRTIRVLDSLNIMHTGTFISDTARENLYPLIIEKNDIRIVLLNYTYGTNGLKIPAPYVINMTDTAIIRKDIQQAELLNPDYIIVTMHWGNEYENDENKAQQDLAVFITSAGADIIIGSHPHVVQPVKKLYNPDSTAFNIVVYSLGNFVSNQRDRYRDGGIMFGITLEKHGNSTELKDFSYLPYWVYRESRPDRNIFYVLPVGYYENNPGIITLSPTDKTKLKQFADDTRLRIKEVPENRFYENNKE